MEGVRPSSSLHSGSNVAKPASSVLAGLTLNIGRLAQQRPGSGNGRPGSGRRPGSAGGRPGSARLRPGSARPGSARSGSDRPGTQGLYWRKNAIEMIGARAAPNAATAVVARFAVHSFVLSIGYVVRHFV